MGSTRLSLAVIAALTCFAAARPLAAQRPGSGAAAVREAAPADTADSVLPGPRLATPWRTARPPRIAAWSAAAPTPESTHTFRFTTLELILIGVIVLILLVR